MRSPAKHRCDAITGLQVFRVNRPDAVYQNSPNRKRMMSKYLGSRHREYALPKHPPSYKSDDMLRRIFAVVAVTALIVCRVFNVVLSTKVSLSCEANLGLGLRGGPSKNPNAEIEWVQSQICSVPSRYYTIILLRRVR